MHAIISHSLERVAGVRFLQLRWDRDAFVVHLPVESPSHGIAGLRLVAEVIVVDHIDHRTHDCLPVLRDAI